MLYLHLVILYFLFWKLYFYHLTVSFEDLSTLVHTGLRHLLARAAQSGWLHCVYPRAVPRSPGGCGVFTPVLTLPVPPAASAAAAREPVLHPPWPHRHRQSCRAIGCVRVSFWHMLPQLYCGVAIRIYTQKISKTTHVFTSPFHTRSLFLQWVKNCISSFQLASPHCRWSRDSYLLLICIHLWGAGLSVRDFCPFFP